MPCKHQKSAEAADEVLMAAGAFRASWSAGISNTQSNRPAAQWDIPKG
jgi:hypothetical protein